MPSGQTLEVWPVPLASESTLKNKKWRRVGRNTDVILASNSHLKTHSGPTFNPKSIETEKPLPHLLKV